MQEIAFTLQKLSNALGNDSFLELLQNRIMETSCLFWLLRDSCSSPVSRHQPLPVISCTHTGSAEVVISLVLPLSQSLNPYAPLKSNANVVQPPESLVQKYTEPVCYWMLFWGLRNEIRDPCELYLCHGLKHSAYELL